MEFRKIPLIERCVHKSWRARLDGYDELMGVFGGIDDAKCPEWKKYLGLMKVLVVDGHALSQERCLEVTLMFVQKAACAGKIVGNVMSGLVQKCFLVPKANVKALALQITLTYIQIGKHDATVAELIRGIEAKNSKIAAASIAVVARALHQFGDKVIEVDSLVKKLPTLIVDRDKNVREETKLLAIELNRWIGDALKPHIASLPNALLVELRKEFDKLDGEEVAPTRYLKSKRNGCSTELTATATQGDVNGRKAGTDDDTTECSENTLVIRQMAGTAPTPGKAVKSAKSVQRTDMLVKKDAAAKNPPEKQTKSILNLAKPKTLPNQRDIPPAKKAMVDEKQPAPRSQAMIGLSELVIEESNGPIRNDLTSKLLLSPIKYTEFNALKTTEDRLQHSIEPPSGPFLPDILPKLDTRLIQMCRKIGISDSMVAEDGINELNELLDKPGAIILQNYEELYVENVCLRFKHLSSMPTSDALANYESLLANIYSFYTVQPLVQNVGAMSLKNLMSSIIGLMADMKLTMVNKERRYASVLNSICVKVLEKSNFTQINCALIRLLTETCSSNLLVLPKFTELLLKCIWQNTKNMPTKSDELNYDAILLEVHEFIVTLSPWWTKNPQPDDIPFRTIVKIVHTFANIKGNDILQHITAIPTNSKLYSILMKCLNTSNKSTEKSSSSNSSADSSAAGSNNDSSGVLSENRMTGAEITENHPNYFAEELNNNKLSCKNQSESVQYGDNVVAKENLNVHEVMERKDLSQKKAADDKYQDLLARYARIRSQK